MTQFLDRSGTQTPILFSDTGVMRLVQRAHPEQKLKLTYLLLGSTGTAVTTVELFLGTTLQGYIPLPADGGVVALNLVGASLNGKRGEGVFLRQDGDGAIKGMLTYMSVAAERNPAAREVVPADPGAFGDGFDDSFDT